ncbi:hypothetical protein [Deinococcus humi]|uniref:Tyrosine specific protein phosphatases domain-containing protein n=1 Tax=Deinococcus humi TaxID=662880 RepID=A0A7W8K242_9DEIO|nr:hypothetical protein [Deinococcus humi]MBB5365874.1 putative protein tyrosine phosphatase [Deinococcus humi]GGO38836.1 hypothetical protein GCM10008949_46060 [Deinococcus humi]
MRVTVSGQGDLPSLKDGTAVIVALDPGTHLSDGSRRLAEHDGPRLNLQVHDVWFDSDRHVVPSDEHLQQIDAFLTTHQPAHLHVSCLAGVSRSAALALYALTRMHPELSDRELVERLLTARPQCFPNPLIVGLVDQRLQRGLTGALQEAFADSEMPWPPA